MRLTRRIDLNLGYSCNIRCRFCYYQQSLGAKDARARRDLTTAQAQHWLRFFRSKGLDEIDLTGGEPTIRADIADLISYARDIGYRSICVISNGLKLADETFARRLVSCGLNDALFSLHGPTAEIHDYLTQSPGSFEKLNRAMRIMAGLGVRCRSNTVVTGLNYTRLEEMVSILHENGIQLVNFILFNPIVEAQGTGQEVRVHYSDVAPHLQNVITGWKDRFRRITVRYMPFCLMRGFEEYITNTPQIQYDPDEWDYYWRTQFRNGLFMRAAAHWLGYLLAPDKTRLLRLDFNAARHEALKWTLTAKNKVKGPQCGRCAYAAICDGLWKEYASAMGFGELKPVDGKRISDPVYFLSRNKRICE